MEQKNIKNKEYTRGRVLQVKKENTVSSALALMISKGIDFLGVVDEQEKVVGSITFEAILKNVFRGTRK